MPPTWQVRCRDNRGYETSLQAGKLYEARRDPRAERLGLLRVVDESGRDYLYLRHRFAVLTLVPSVG